MEWAIKIFDQWAEEEDDDVMRIMAKLYGPLMQYSLIFPSWQRSHIIITFGIIFIFIIGVPLHFLILGFSTIRLKDHFDLASMVFHYFLIFGFVQITLAILNKNRDVIAGLHRIMASELGNYASGRIYDEKEPQSFEKNKKKELMQFLCLPGSVIVVAALSLSVPYIKKLIEEKSSDEAHYTRGGVNLNLPIALYYPFPTHTGILHVVAVLGQLMAAAVLVVIIGSMELMLFRVTQAVIFEYKVLQYAVGSVFQRAKILYAKTYPGQTTDGLPISDPQLQSCIGVCFCDCIEHHHKIAELLKRFEGAVKWPGAMAYTFGTGVIGLSLINMLDAKEAGNYEMLVLFMGMMFAEALNMYIVSMFGEDITTESKSLRNVLYDIKWYQLNIKNRKTMLNFQVGITNPVIVKAGGLVALCMDTFSSIINSSYSFFNLVNANY